MSPFAVWPKQKRLLTPHRPACKINAFRHNASVYMGRSVPAT